MPILLEADLAIYAPSIQLSGQALEGAMAYVQIIMESSIGANRPLELQSFTEIKKLNKKAHTIYPSYVPIADTPEMQVDVRVSRSVSRGGLPTGTSEWQSLESGAWSLDELWVIHLDLMSSWAFNRNDFAPYHANEARLTYSAGFDFTIPSTDVNAIKAIAGQILTYTQENGGFQGIKAYEVNRQFRVEYQDTGGRYGQERQFSTGQVPDAFLLPLKKYAPRGFY